MTSGSTLAYERLEGELHRHGSLTHAHPHVGPHDHHAHHGHSHGLIDPSIRRSRAGLRAVGISLAVLGATAAIQAVIYVATGSVALLADLIHNFGDALTAVPVGAAFMLHSERAERTAGLVVVAAIFLSACVAGVLAVEKIVNPQPPDHLLALALAGVIGCLGNEVAAQVRLRTGRRLDSPALVADGYHARTDGLVSLGVVLSAVLVALGLTLADPIIAIVITGVILEITVQSWRTVRGHSH
jgi:cation diffusion facilitator family transporter